MRRTVVFVLACLFVMTITSDRFVCLDGCSDEPATESSTSLVSACAMCHAWTAASAITAERPDVVVSPPAVRDGRTPADPLLPITDPPPKRASSLS